LRGTYTAEWDIHGHVYSNTVEVLTRDYNEVSVLISNEVGAGSAPFPVILGHDDGVGGVHTDKIYSCYILELGGPTVSRDMDGGYTIDPGTVTGLYTVVAYMASSNNPYISGLCTNQHTATFRVFLSVDLDADVDRNGIVDSSDDLGEESWTNNRGAFAIAAFTNYLDGLTKLVVQPPDVSSFTNYTLRLRKVDTNTQGCLKLYKPDGTELVFTSGLADISSIASTGLTLYASSLSMWSYDTTLSLENAHLLQYKMNLELIIDGGLVASDTVTLCTAPFIIPSEIAPVEAVYVTDRFPTNTSIANLRCIDNEGDVWAQDFVKIAPCHTSNSITQVVIDLLHPDKGYFVPMVCENDKLQFAGWLRGGENVANGGNLMISPPIAGYPYGRPIVGDKDTSFTNYLEMCKIQTNAVITETSWLMVGHIDEVIMFADTNKILYADPWKAANLLHDEIVAGHLTNEIWFGTEMGESRWKTIPEVAIAAAVSGYKTNTILSPGLAANTNDATLAFSNLVFEIGDYLRVDNEILKVTATNGYNVTMKRAQASTIATSHANGTITYALSENLIENIIPGDEKPCVAPHIINVTNIMAHAFPPSSFGYISIPVLFHYKTSPGIGFVAISANACNCLVVPGDHVYYSYTGCTAFEQYIGSVVSNASPVDVWLNYHCGFGEVHCGSATRRTIPTSPAWWTY